MEHAEKVMMTLDMNTPVYRAVFGFLVPSLPITYLKPSYMFKENGEPKSFGLGEENTLLPWYVPGVICGGILSLFL